jgi:hypothetical protein
VSTTEQLLIGDAAGDDNLFYHLLVFLDHFGRFYSPTPMHFCILKAPLYFCPNGAMRIELHDDRTELGSIWRPNAARQPLNLQFLKAAEADVCVHRGRCTHPHTSRWPERG